MGCSRSSFVFKLYYLFYPPVSYVDGAVNGGTKKHKTHVKPMQAGTTDLGIMSKQLSASGVSTVGFCS